MVTGASGKLGSFVVVDLISQGYSVVGIDHKLPMQVYGERFAFIQGDTTVFDTVKDAMHGSDAIIHLSAIPSPIHHSESETFRVNMLSNWNVLESAQEYGISKVVMASSVNAVGAVYSAGITPRPYFPIDEEQPTFCEDAYSQSKWLGEEMANAFCRRRSMQIASMRFHALWTNQEKIDWYHKLQANQLDPFGTAAKHFWGWTDIVEGAIACRLALEQNWQGHEAFFINSDDTSTSIPTMECITHCYPSATIKEPMPEFTTAISNSKAKRMLNWIQKSQWRNLDK